MKIYTKKGDKGRTSLFSGEEVSKDDIRLDLLGELDHLGVEIGGLRLIADPKLEGLLQGIQELLFNLAAHIAGFVDPNADIDSLLDQFTQDLEKGIDELTADLPVLKNFVLPGEVQSNVQANRCRVLTRRCERLMVRSSKVGIEIKGPMITFINRLSDFFFTVGRHETNRLSAEEKKWQS